MSVLPARLARRPAQPVRPARPGGRLLPLAAAAMALLVALTAAVAAAPPTTLAASPMIVRCDGTNLRTRPSTSARTVRTLAAGAKVVTVAKVSGTRWSVRCGGKTTAGSTWYRVSSINGRSVKSLYGVTYVYGASVLFKSAVTPKSLVTACSGVSLRTGPRTTARARVRLASGSRVTAYGTVAGGAWKATCAGAVSGSSWYRITAVNGKSVKTLYGVTYLYGARGLFKSPPAPSSSTPTPKPTPTPVPTPIPTPAATPDSGYTEGIDVSHWQGAIDWTAVAAAGKQFAYIKASQGIDFVDEMYATNRAQAKANGLRVGAYHFAGYTATPQKPAMLGDPIAEADHFVDTAAPASGELLPVLDLENTGGLDVLPLQEWVKAFLGRVYDRTGIRAAIYVSPSFWSNKMGNTGWFAANGYPTLWIAHWEPAAGVPTLPASNWGGQGWTFWQYTSGGTVPGIGGRVDLDRYRSGDFTPVLIP